MREQGALRKLRGLGRAQHLRWHLAHAAHEGHVAGRSSGPGGRLARARFAGASWPRGRLPDSFGGRQASRLTDAGSGSRPTSPSQLHGPTLGPTMSIPCDPA